MQHRKITTATIARPLPEVFDWVTTPAYWPLFWPVTLAVDVAEPWRPFRIGDHCREHIEILAWRGHVDWTVDLVERPHRCVLTAVSSGDTVMSKLGGHNTGRIEYTLSGDDRTTEFQRDMTYPIEG